MYMPALSYVDLFCGCGGFSLGFKQEGFVHLGGIDIDGAACASYATNIGQVMHADITDLHPGTFRERVGSRPDIVLASPPCEGFSEANEQRRGDRYDRLYEFPGSLTITAIDWICDLDPRVGFIIENVPAMGEGELRDLITTEFRRIGYGKVFFNMIRAETAGSASRRPRLFISNLPFAEPLEVPACNRIFPGAGKAPVELDDDAGAGEGPAVDDGTGGAGDPWHGTVTVMDAIGDLPDPTSIHEFDDHALLGSIGKKESSIRGLRWGDSLVSFAAAGEKNKNTWIRLHPFRPAPIVMGKSIFVHPFDDRQLTIRETARLQGFPDTFRLSGNVYERRNQVGEAVCPLVSRYLATLGAW